MKKITFLLPLLLIGNMYAQTYNWAQKFNTDQITVKKAQTTSLGDIVIAGTFKNTVDFNLGSGVNNLISTNASEDIFVAKYDYIGTLIFAYKIGGLGNDVFSDFAIDNSNNILLGGSVNAVVDMNPGNVTNNIGSLNINTTFLAKYSPSFTYQWAKSFSNNISIASLERESNGGIIYTGTFTGTADFNPSLTQTNNLTAAGSSDIFIGRILFDGSYSWAKKIGASTSYESVKDLFVDSLNNIHITGVYSGTVDFDPSSVTNNLIGTNDLFFAKYTLSGTYIFAKSVNGNSTVKPSNISVDKDGNIILTGIFYGAADFDPSNITQNLASATSTTSDVFISKYTNLGAYSWAKRMGNNNNDSIANHYIDKFSNIILYGSFKGTVDFDITNATFNLTSSGSNTDLFISVIKSTGGFYKAFKLGNSNKENEAFLCIDKNSNIYVLGSFLGTVDFNPSPAVANLIASSKNIFIAKYSLPAIAIKTGTTTEETVSSELNEESTTNSISVYPNPTTNVIHISTEKEILSYEIFDITGKMIISNQNNNNNSVDVSELPNNIYFIIVTNIEGEKMQTKFIKQ